MKAVRYFVFALVLLATSEPATAYGNWWSDRPEEKQPTAIAYDMDGDREGGVPILCQYLSDALAVTREHREYGYEVAYRLYRKLNATKDSDGAVLCGPARKRSVREPHRIVWVKEVVQVEWLCFVEYRQKRRIRVPRFVIIILLERNPTHPKYRVILAVHDILPDALSHLFDPGTITNEDVCGDE